MRYIPPADPWGVPPLDEIELLAIKSLAAGKASGPQQQLALKVIVQKFAGTYDLSFRPGGADGERATSFAEGKRFVGTRIVEAIDRPMKVKGSPYGGSTDDREAELPGRRNPKPGRGGKPARPEA